MSGQVEDDDYDPFADVSMRERQIAAGLPVLTLFHFQIEDSYSVMDVEANLLRDKHSSLCAIVSAMIERLQATSTEEALIKDTTELVSSSEWMFRPG